MAYKLSRVIVDVIYIQKSTLELNAGEMIEKPKSVCIAGPRFSGKKLLVNAICNATKAVLFDLTPKVLMGKYPEKEDKKMFIIMLNKMTRVLQPSVIFIDGAEKPFYKKVPKPEKKQEPKKLKAVLQKGILKKLLPEDRVMVIATTRQPWAATPRPFIKTYDKFILIPRTDYGTIFMLWTSILMKYPGIPRDINISALTKITIGYPIPVIYKIAEQVLTARRIIEMRYKKFSPKEIQEYLIKGKGIEPVTAADEALFTGWYIKKVPMGKRRTKILTEAEEQRVLLEMQAAKAAKKKK